MKRRCRRRSSKGTALVETALVLSMLVLLMLNVVNFGMYIHAWITVNNAARAATEYRVYNGVVLGFPPPPKLADVQKLVTEEVSSLPNRGSVTVEICTTASGNTTCEGTGATFVPPPDPTIYRVYAVEIGYPFDPLFPLFPLSGRTTIRRQVAMRSME